jgi:AcrR family transcriptional regulator
MSENGKTKVAFYTRFQSKEDLMNELMRTRLDRKFEAIVEETLTKMKEENVMYRRLSDKCWGRYIRVP